MASHVIVVLVIEVASLLYRYIVESDNHRCNELVVESAVEIGNDTMTVQSEAIPIKYCPLMIKLLKEVGGEYAEELIKYLLNEFEEDPLKIWQSDIFGKSLNELVNEGLRNKLCHMPQDARGKIQETLEKIINEGCSGLICIIL